MFGESSPLAAISFSNDVQEFDKFQKTRSDHDQMSIARIRRPSNRNSVRSARPFPER